MQDILKLIKDNAKELSEEQFEKNFDMAWDNMQSSFKKLEIEQYYQCDMDNNYINFTNGNFDELIDSFKEFENIWPSKLKDKPNVVLNRLHIITTPITDYLKYEMYFYLVNEKTGENIKCLDIKDTNLDYSYLYDFIIFDDKQIIINCHKNNGEYIKSLYYDKDINLIKELSKEYDRLFCQGKHYKYFAEFNQTLIENMKKESLI